MQPTLADRLSRPDRLANTYVIRAYTEGGYFKQCSFESDSELSESEAVNKAKRIMGDCYGAHKWEVERICSQAK